MLAQYEFFKFLHIISVISWMVGLLYLPRIYVYHSENLGTHEISKVFIIMQRKLLYYIMTPAMISSYVFGIILIKILGIEYIFHAGWMHVKLLALLIMTIFHFILFKYHKDFSQDKNTHSSKFFRIINEVPTILMLIIVYMVTVKPF